MTKRRKDIIVLKVVGQLSKVSRCLVCKYLTEAMYIICALSVSAGQPITTGLLKPRLLAGVACNTLTRLLKRFATSFSANVLSAVMSSSVRTFPLAGYD